MAHSTFIIFGHAVSSPRSRSNEIPTEIASMLRRLEHNLTWRGSIPFFPTDLGNFWFDQPLTRFFAGSPISTASCYPRSLAQGDFMGSVEVIGSICAIYFTAPFLESLFSSWSAKYSFKGLNCLLPWRQHSWLLVRLGVDNACCCYPSDYSLPGW